MTLRHLSCLPRPSSAPSTPNICTGIFQIRKPTTSHGGHFGHWLLFAPFCWYARNLGGTSLNLCSGRNIVLQGEDLRVLRRGKCRQDTRAKWRSGTLNTRSVRGQFCYPPQFPLIISSMSNIPDNIICLNYVLLDIPLNESLIALYVDVKKDWMAAQLSNKVARQEHLMPTRLGMYKVKKLNFCHSFYLLIMLLLCHQFNKRIHYRLVPIITNHSKIP